MKYMIYEDAMTHRFTFLRLPNRYVEGDELPAVTIDRWFDSHADALAALPELFARDEPGPDAGVDDTAPVGEVVLPIDTRRH